MRQLNQTAAIFMPHAYTVAVAPFPDHRTDHSSKLPYAVYGALLVQYAFRVFLVSGTFGIYSKTI